MIARYDLAKSGRSGPTETMAEEFKGVIKWLQDVQKGIAQLDAPKAGLAGESSGSRFSDREPIFTPDNLRWS
ncbi:hypothetical protein DPQ22_02880 [Candidatus Tokpelaia sp.]|nr:hypothetical protein DPQ22_02880 [Candidatus Tokpelaia sp.]